MLIRFFSKAISLFLEIGLHFVTFLYLYYIAIQFALCHTVQAAQNISHPRGNNVIITYDFCKQMLCTPFANMITIISIPNAFNYVLFTKIIYWTS